MEYESIVSEKGTVEMPYNQEFHYDYKVKIDGVTLLVAHKVRNSSDYVAVEEATKGVVYADSAKKNLSKDKFFENLIKELEAKTRGGTLSQFVRCGK